MAAKQSEEIGILKVNADKWKLVPDQVTIEEPLEIRIAYSSATGKMFKNIAVTMRTPGDDQDLAAGFLYTEGIISEKNQIAAITINPADQNRILVELKDGFLPDIKSSERNFYSSSSCGICGKASIDAILTVAPYEHLQQHQIIKREVFVQLAGILRSEQQLFKQTGGIHACALFDFSGNFILLKEDIGRHNALDKLIGYNLMHDHLPLNNGILLLSGRAGFELIQKAAMAGIKFIAAIGAPSSLAVEMAKENKITLIGFLRENCFNIYSGEENIQL